MDTHDTADRQDLQSLFLSVLPTLDRGVGMIGRRHGLSEADAEEFGAWFKARVIESDYAVLRKFGGKSTLTTYLSAVLVNAFKDYRNAKWGRWRPSAEARRRGTLAIRLEAMICRDGWSVREAVSALENSDGHSRDRVRELARQFRPRTRPREVDVSAAHSEPAPQGSDGFWESEHAAGRERAFRLLTDQIARLGSEDQLVLRMRFWDGLSVAEIARALHLDQKPLYRRLERLEGILRSMLMEVGLTRADVRQILVEEAK